MIDTHASPYTMDEQPTSVGRALLARAFAHWCALHYGLEPEQVAAALHPDGEVDPASRREVHFAARLLGELFGAGRMRTWVRPFGGGTPAVLPRTDWELDDFRRRFASSATDPSRPFDPEARPTHWIFIDLDDFNRVVEESCGSPARHPSGSAPGTASAQSAQPGPHERPMSASSNDRLIRMPEVTRRTGMSASTVYRRIEQERFPRQVPMEHGNIAAWWESEIDEWVAQPR